MKNIKVVWFGVGLILLAAVVIASTLFLINHFLSGDSKAKQPAAVQCTSKGTAHIVTIQNEEANPKHTNGKLCDTLTITDNDNKVLLIAFGPHDDHQPYDGITEQDLKQGQSLTVTLNQAGTYDFHDHIGDVIQGDFTVTK